MEGGGLEAAVHTQGATKALPTRRLILIPTLTLLTQRGTHSLYRLQNRRWAKFDILAMNSGVAGT